MNAFIFLASENKNFFSLPTLATSIYTSLLVEVQYRKKWLAIPLNTLL